MFRLNTILPFAFFAIANALPPAGTYNIISRILSPSGQQLAVTFNGEGAAVTLQPLASTDIAQIWNLQVVTSVGMSFVPLADSTQRIAGFQTSGVTALSSQASVGTGAIFNVLQSASTGVSIGGAGPTPSTFWSATDTEVGSELIFGPSPLSERQFWLLIPNNN
ncbi:hypothetical protein HYPSUDRAFT_1074345 [Hypholoma sublateritium FD-334 SS-4]|uniref:CCL2-like lectin domain-containing protein n=1 Tax=Hypholoma sublateritium (strain FD-334 SS-4) TaxID=945553 RepID=A0A0D2NBW4_HYPSF|nr:hypothetical protein HYPSUDRAFT_1074345 [Hypholoma sublateritium FD-334 SS-4]